MNYLIGREPDAPWKSLSEWRQVFDVMRRAYRIRSRVVHGGAIDNTKLPDKADASVADFTSAVEQVMRAGLRKALIDRGIGTDGYWEELLFSDTTEANP